jgi:hypothetical protein
VELYLKARSGNFGLSFFYPFKKADRIIVQGMKRKISSSSLRWAKGGSKTTVGQFF